mmetsp:Transcript_31122/g.72458  ORF Transcript_31122/g.72458 Transcript_31122/m.72458 type:complete len:214 (-) Transcript_31122:764-1405(-)
MASHGHQACIFKWTRRSLQQATKTNPRRTHVVVASSIQPLAWSTGPTWVMRSTLSCTLVGCLLRMAPQMASRMFAMRCSEILKLCVWSTISRALRTTSSQSGGRCFQLQATTQREPTPIKLLGHVGSTAELQRRASHRCTGAQIWCMLTMRRTCWRRWMHLRDNSGSTPYKPSKTAKLDVSRLFLVRHCRSHGMHWLKPPRPCSCLVEGQSTQ